MLSVRGLVKHFPVRSKGLIRRVVGQVHAVCGLDFDVYPGETLGIVGESGCGKSTTGRAVLHLQPATSGEVHLRGPRRHHAQGRDLRHSVATCSSSSRTPMPRSTRG